MEEHNENNDQRKIFTIPTETFKMSKGTVELPIYYYDYGYAHFIFFVNYEAAKKKLEETAFLPCKFFGKAIALLNFFSISRHRNRPL